MQNPEAKISKSGKGEKILVVQTSFLGDAVLTTPLISGLRNLFPEAELAVMCAPRSRAIFEGNPDINQIIIDEKNGFGGGFLGTWRQARELRQQGFSIAVSPHKSFRTALLLFFSLIPYRVGFRQSSGWFLYHRRVDREVTKHDVERNLSLLEAFGINADGYARRLKVPDNIQGRDNVESLFRSLNLQKDKGRMIFGINGGSVWPTKRWRSEAFAELMVELKRLYCCEILLFGGEDDRTTINQIQERSGYLGVDLVGKISLTDLSYALDWCDLFITNDSGPMHIAVAREVPVVAIFCATTPSLGFYPYSSRAVVVEKTLSCRPCSSHGGLRCPLGTEDCIRLIKPRDVLRAVNLLLEKRSRLSIQAESYLPEYIRL